MIVGIDLGTTNSLVAAFTEEGPVIIPNRLGKHLTPSVVSVDENGNVYAGETAQERRNLYPDSVAQAFKRSMGTDRTYDLSGQKVPPRRIVQHDPALSERRCGSLSGGRSHRGRDQCTGLF